MRLVLAVACFAFVGATRWTEVLEMDLSERLRTHVDELKNSEMIAQLSHALPILSKLSPSNIKDLILGKDYSTLAYLQVQAETLFEESVSGACLADIMFYLTRASALAVDTVAINHCHKIRNPNSEDGKPKTDMCKCAAPFGQSAKKDAWVTAVADAAGKLPTGVLQGNLWFLGSYEECRRISVRKAGDSQWKGKYCMANLATHANRDKGPQTCRNATATTTSPHNGTADGFFSDPLPKQCSGAIVPHFGLCVPQTCTERDINTIINTTLALVGQPNAFCNIDVDCKEELLLEKDSGAIFMLTFCVMTAGLMLLASLYDSTVYTPAVPANYTAKEAKGHYDKQPWLVRVLISFSIGRNIGKILDTNRKPGQIECLMGIRFISLTWVILGHTYYWALPTLDNPLKAFDLPNNILNQIILNASFCVDAFYIIGGCLLTYLWFKGMEEAKGRPIRNPGFWLMFYVHRFIRLTPVYMVVLGIDATLYRYMGTGPFWDQAGMDSASCAKSWWTNLLYINNFANQDDLCMSWTWYLANDFQFYLFAPIFLVTLWHSEILGLILGGASLLVSGIIQAALTVPWDWPPISIFSSDPAQFDLANSYWQDIYVKPYIRCRPYIVGILLGYLLHKRRGTDKKIPQWVAWLGWALATATACGILFGLYDYSRTSEITTVGRVLYAVFARTLWALAVAWLIFACAEGYGGLVNRFLSWPGFMPLAKMTYCAYLVHPLFVHGYYSSRMRPLHFGTQYQMIMYFFGHVITSYAAAFVLCLAFEIPVLGLEEIIFPKQKPRKAARDGADQTLIPNGANPLPQKDGADNGGDDVAARIHRPSAVAADADVTEPLIAKTQPLSV